MTDQTKVQSQRGKDTLSKPIKFWLALFTLIVAAYGVMTIQYAYAVKAGIPPWSTMLTYISTPGYSGSDAGMTTGKENFLNYRNNYAISMSSHFVLGGLVMILGVFQFIPSFRTKYRQIHRGLGVLLFLGMLTVSTSSIIYLSGNSPEENIGGVMFWFLLLGLTAFSLFFLLQAALAIYNKQFRNHMLWMGLAYSCYLTAPFLRLNYPITGNLDPQTINRIIPSSATSVMLQTILLFCLWLIYVGEKDLPNRKKIEITEKSRAIVSWIANLALVSLVLIAGVVFMVDTSAHLLGDSTSQLIALVAFVVCRGLHILLAKQNWFAAVKGERPSILYSLVTLLGVGSTFYIGWQINTELYIGHIIFYTIISPAILELLFLLLAHTSKPLSNGSNLISHISSATSWVWAAVPGTLLGAYLLGIALDEAIAISIVLSVPLGIVGAILYATQVDFNFGFRRRLQSQPPKNMTSHA